MLFSHIVHGFRVFQKPQPKRSLMSGIFGGQGHSMLLEKCAVDSLASRDRRGVYQGNAGDGSLRGGEPSGLGVQEVAGAHIQPHLIRCAKDGNARGKEVAALQGFLQCGIVPANDNDMFFVPAVRGEIRYNLLYFPGAHAASHYQVADSIQGEPELSAGIFFRYVTAECAAHGDAEGQQFFRRYAAHHKGFLQ